MKNKSFCNRAPQSPVINAILFAALILCILAYAPYLSAGNDAPQWMHALVNSPLPPHDEKTDAVLLYSEENVTVLSTDKIKRQVRYAYKILRPSGKEHGTAWVPFRSPAEKVTSLRGWCIPAQGKDYEVKDKEAMEVALPKVDGSDLISDVRVKIIHIPAPEPGNIIGYEAELEERPLVLQDEWNFQTLSPARESHYSVQLPAGWEYKTSWLNYKEVKPVQAGSNLWQWTVSDVKGVREEEEMPPLRGVAGLMIVSFFPPGGAAANGFASWREMGTWYSTLTTGRRDASAEIKQEVASLTSSATTPAGKMRLLAQFVQHDIRYVAIELGIGGFQPHPAAEIFSHRYGDCKDKATIFSSMLHEIGVDSYYVVINSERGSVTPSMPAYAGGFNHAIVAIKLPLGITDPSLVATVQHPTLGKLLFFDPTDELTPFGKISGPLQANYGLLVTPDGGELVELPKQPAVMNSIERTAKLTLDINGQLKGDVKETRSGDRAWSERWALRTVTKDSDRIKPIENLLAGSLANFRITKATLINFQQTDQPFGFNYSFEAERYAKNVGDLLLIRPRVLGTEASGLLETKEARNFPIEFRGPALDTDTFEITIPSGYEVDDLPPPVDADFSFASYHSKSEVTGNVIRYTRAFEVKELSVPVSKSEDLKKFYRIIATDERNTAVLKPVTQAIGSAGNR
ncbi:MAG TPA: DUF3857 and transglutaminase domain-containing protein [Terriglobales bacterium]|nr:DUF3857 and transglutaminase domain-containing protein [Terriglobales bacterium]